MNKWSERVEITTDEILFENVLKIFCKRMSKTIVNLSFSYIFNFPILAYSYHKTSISINTEFDAKGNVPFDFTFQ